MSENEKPVSAAAALLSEAVKVKPKVTARAERIENFIPLTFAEFVAKKHALLQAQYVAGLELKAPPSEPNEVWAQRFKREYEEYCKPPEQVDINSHRPTVQTAIMWAGLRKWQRHTESAIILRRGKQLYIPAADGRSAYPAVAANLEALVDSYFRFAEDENDKMVKKLTASTKHDLLKNVPEDFWEYRGTTRVPVILRGKGADTSDLEFRALVEPGYDAATGLFYDPNSQMDEVMAPENDFPDAAAAYDFLRRDWLHDMALRDAESEAAYLAYAVTPFIRHLVNKTPGFGFNAHNPNAGKTQWSALIESVVTGQDAGLATWCDEQELGRLITGILRDGAPVQIFDNIRGTLESPTMEQLLTSGAYKARETKSAAVPILANNTVWVFTGNNLTLNNDMARRLVMVHLDLSEGQRTERYRHRNLEDFSNKNRAKIVRALLTICEEGLNRYYSDYNIQAQAPKFGKFAQWLHAVWPICFNLGLTRLLRTDPTLANRSVEDIALAEFYAQANAKFGDSWVPLLSVRGFVLERLDAEPMFASLPFVENESKGAIRPSLVSSKAMNRFFQAHNGTTAANGASAVCRFNTARKAFDYKFTPPTAVPEDETGEAGDDRESEPNLTG